MNGNRTQVRKFGQSPGVATSQHRFARYDSGMKIEREQAEGRNMFTGYGQGYVEVNRTRYSASLVVGADKLVTDWPLESIDGLAADHLAAILQMKPEIVLLGTGATFVFPEPALLAPLRNARVGVEVMDTAAACRTYNILLAEGRNVVAALIV
jgi:uncharacterized protein